MHSSITRHNDTTYTHAQWRTGDEDEDTDSSLAAADESEDESDDGEGETTIEHQQSSGHELVCRNLVLEASAILGSSTLESARACTRARLVKSNHSRLHNSLPG